MNCHPSASARFHAMSLFGSTGRTRGMPAFAPDDGGAGGGSPEPEPTPTPEPDAKPRLTDQEARLLREVMSLKSKVKERDAALARFDGIDPDELRSALAASRDREHEALAKAGKLDELRSALAAESQKQVAERDASITALRNQLDEQVIGGAFASSTFLRDRTSLTVEKARELYGAFIDQEDGRPVVYDAERGTSGSRLPFIGGDAEPLPFDRALERLIQERGDSHVLRADEPAPGAARRSAGPSVAAGLDAISASLDAGALSRLANAQKGQGKQHAQQQDAAPGALVFRDQAASRIAAGLGSILRIGNR